MKKLRNLNFVFSWISNQLFLVLFGAQTCSRMPQELESQALRSCRAGRNLCFSLAIAIEHALITYGCQLMFSSLLSCIYKTSNDAF